MAISTGTNNVVPTLVEGTIAGFAAAHVALRSEAEREDLCWRHKRLLVQVNGETIDQALVEVALLNTRFTGARAVWETGTLRQVFVSRAQPVNIGLSAIVGMVRPVDLAHPHGAFVSTTEDGRKVMVPIAPGMVVPVGIGEIVEMEPGVSYPVEPLRPATLALDGEREITLNRGDEATVRLDLDGPWIVDVERERGRERIVHGTTSTGDAPRSGAAARASPIVPKRNSRSVERRRASVRSRFA